MILKSTDMLFYKDYTTVDFVISVSPVSIMVLKNRYIIDCFLTRKRYDISLLQQLFDKIEFTEMSADILMELISISKLF